MPSTSTKPFKKGHPYLGGGRKKGQQNRVTVELKQLLNRMIPEERLEKMWEKYLRSQNEQIAFKTFELMLHYRFGKPVQPIVGEENAPPIKIDISAIPKFRIKA